MSVVNAYEDFGFMVMRTPLLPMYEMRDNKLNLFISDTDTYESLLQKIDTNNFSEALLISSPDLYNELMKIRGEGITENNKNAFRKIVCYYFRMSVRPTPFGISAGVSVVNMAPLTDIRLNGMNTHRKKISINFDFINKLFASLRKDSSFLKKQSYFANNSLYRNFRGFHFTKTDQAPYLKASIPYSPIIEDILAYAKEAMPYSALMKHMTEGLGYPADISETFLEKLIGMELLLPAIYPSLFGCSNPDDVVKVLRSSGVKNNLWGLAGDMDEFEQKSFGQGIESITRINQCMEEETASDKLHVISEFSLSKNLMNQQIGEEINKTLFFLCKLRGLKGCVELKRFIAEFALRYGTKEIPLSEALDEHTGIGYPVLKKPFIRNKLTEHLRHLDLEELDINKDWDSFLLALLNRFYENKDATEIVLTEYDLNSINSRLGENDLTESIYATFSLLAKSGEEVDKGNYMIDFLFAGGPSCVNPLNRFAHLSDGLDAKINACSVWENEYHKQRGLHCAEINFIPRRGIGGNILTRGNFRENEIPVVTAPTPGRDIFSINDIYLCQEKGKLFAIDKKSNKKILPVATVMYDNHNTASVNYNSFLTDLGHQEKLYNLGWSWGSLVTALHHFPRVRYGKCILSKEMWMIRMEELGNQPADIKKELRSLLKKRKVPAWINYIEKTDNLLFLNLKNDVCIGILESKLKKYGQVLLAENLQGRDNTFVASDMGLHSNEFVLPMRLSDKFINRPLYPDSVKKIKKDPGTGYSHIRIGCNHYLVDEVIQLVLTNFCDGVTGNKLINFSREDAPAGIVFSILENGDREIGIADLDLLFSSYKEQGHIYNITIDHGETLHDINALPDSIVCMNTGMIVELIQGLKGKKEMPAPDLRFIALLITGVQYAKRLFTTGNERQEMIRQLLLEKELAISAKAAPVQKKTLAAGYRQIIEQLEAHYDPLIRGIKVSVDRLMPGENEFSILSDRSTAFYNLIGLTGNKLLYTSLNDSEWIVVLDFIKQYLHNEANLGKYKGIYL